MRSLSPRDTYLKDTLDTIDRCGWSVCGVSGDACSCCAADGRDPEPSSGPPFCYTVGLTARGLPELLLTGMVAAPVLNQLAERLVADGLPAGRYVGALGGEFDVVVVPATDPATLERFVVTPLELYPFSAVSVLQAIWPDEHNRMSWEPGCSLTPGLQPILSDHDLAALPRRPWR